MEGMVWAVLGEAEEEVSVLTITIQVDAPVGQAVGVKEDLAMLLERWGDTRVVEVRETAPEQMTIQAPGR